MFVVYHERGDIVEYDIRKDISTCKFSGDTIGVMLGHDTLCFYCMDCSTDKKLVPLEVHSVNNETFAKSKKTERTWIYFQCPKCKKDYKKRGNWCKQAIKFYWK